MEVESPDGRPALEADAGFYARRAAACRAELRDYQASPTGELVNSLIACLDHPDAGLRSEILDLLPDRRLWEDPHYDSQIKPALWEVAQRFRDDPSRRVRLHADQLAGHLFNQETWRYHHPTKEQQEIDRRGYRRILIFGGACAGLLLLLFGRSRRPGRRRRG